MRGRIAATQTEVNFRTPPTMFSDQDTQANTAAAVAASSADSETAPNGAHTETNATGEGAAEQNAPASTEQSAPAATEPAEAVNTSPETPTVVTTEQAAPVAESHAVDPEAAAAAEEAAGSEEMSKLLEENDEKQEAAASHAAIEVKVVPYTEPAVALDLRRKP